MSGRQAEPRLGAAQLDLGTGLGSNLGVDDDAARGVSEAAVGQDVLLLVIDGAGTALGCADRTGVLGRAQVRAEGGGGVDFVGVVSRLEWRTAIGAAAVAVRRQVGTVGDKAVHLDCPVSPVKPEGETKHD